MTATAVLAPFLYLALNWSTFPETVPSHFGISGQPDAWGPRWLLLPVPLLGLVIVSLLTIGRRFPHHFNYPVKITAENADSQHRLAVSFLDRLRIVVAVMLSYISIQQMRTALNLTTGLGVAFPAAVLLLLLATIGTYFVRVLQAR